MDAEQRKELESQLSAYLDGELTDAQRAEVEAFLAQDAQARQLLAEIRATVAGLHALPRAKASGDLMADVRSRLERQALLGDTRSSGAMPSASPSIGGRWIAAAAVIALAVVAGAVLWSFTDTEPGHRHSQFVMNQPAEAPQKEMREERNQVDRQVAREATHLGDKAEPPEAMTDRYDVPAAAPQMTKHLAGAGGKSETGHAMMRGKAPIDSMASSPNEPTHQPLRKPLPSRGLLAEKTTTEGRVHPADYRVGQKKENEEVMTVALPTAPAGGTQIVVRAEPKTRRAGRQAASQPRKQPKYGSCIANRPVKIGVQYVSPPFAEDYSELLATLPATMPCRPVSTQPSSTQPAASTQSTPQTQPATSMPAH